MSGRIPEERSEKILKLIYEAVFRAIPEGTFGRNPSRISRRISWKISK